ncbi:OLC1v1014552C1 [Oldenlandia corymbosa var. corymbosa]|uniref:non-specific serine/threonine protein kinase n=1 Tax=Oldenlandia corymbosa var. corymbosa TaxID=529605 RepID=A0AAV1E1A0_OLDCO|nr:OLC1v1014552C1 [Oldenlandia corymbosa var. corymbosa]
MPSRLLLSSDSRPNSKPTVVFLAITISASLIIFFAILYFVYYLWYSLVHRSRTSPFDSATSLVKLQRFTYRELKSATNGFSESNLIGKGGSGTVYRGSLKDGKMVAVKLLDSVSLQSEREFQNELQVLGGLRSPLIVNLLGYCVEKNKRLVVYEYMPNRSLQESLFSESNLSLNWARRFDIISDVAKALSFLHLECDPPVIHGDVKPSNVLLDSEYRAKLSDFGLSRLKLEVDFGADLFSQDLGKSQELWKSQELSGNLGTGGGGTDTPVINTPVESQDEVDFALALQASSSRNSKVSHTVKNFGFASLSYNDDDDDDVLNENGSKKANGKGKEISTTENGGENWNKITNQEDEPKRVESSQLNLNLNAGSAGDDKVIGVKQWGKDWWWMQDGSGELCSKDYVMEWIGSQICESTTPDWDEEKKCFPDENVLGNAIQPNMVAEKLGNKSQEAGFGYPGKELEAEGSNQWTTQNKNHKKMQDWWREEHLDVHSKKKAKVFKVGIKGKNAFKALHFGLGKRLCFKTRKRQQISDVDNDQGEFSFRKGWKKKNARSVNSEMWSGDLFSRELSSTTSMRGTLCYVAPEYGGCGYLLENSDVYSFGVLILVIISGRRPLHVLSSPMKLERANLISWCRHLAHAGNVLEIIDEKLRSDYNKEQASLCIHLALACLQKVPELRPQIGDIVKMLKGEMELPSLPFEFSPSPPSKLYSRSRRRLRSNPE